MSVGRLCDYLERTTKESVRKETVYPLRIFKGYEEIWESGKTYKYTVNGRFGCYVKYANIV